MTKINYQLANGQEVEIDVPDKVADVTVELETEECRDRWREKKRNTASVDELKEKGFEVGDDYDLSDDCLNRLDSDALKAAIAKLNASQQQLIYDVYFKEIPITELAKLYGVNRRSIHYRLETIHKKLKKLLEKDFSL